MKIIARSFEDQDPAILLGMIHDSKTIKDAFDGKFHEVVRWAIIDQEIENRKPSSEEVIRLCLEYMRSLE